MIEIGQLAEDDVGRRVIYEVAPGIENPAQLGAWTADILSSSSRRKSMKGCILSST